MNDVVNEKDQQTTDVKDVSVETKPKEAGNGDDVISMPKTDYERAIQSAEDKVRGEYSKKVRDLEKQIAKLTPPEKTEAELALEKRLSDLEAKERETEAKEKLLNLQSYLQANNIDLALADYLKADVDAEAFVTAIDKYMNERLSTAGYKPTGHPKNQEVSVDQWKAMTYGERERLYHENPTLADSLMRGQKR